VPSPVAEPGFRLFFAGRLVSLLGSSMAPVALAFAVLDAAHRPGDLGIVLAAHMVPLLVFLLVGGAMADRFSRRTVLVLANVGDAGLTQGAVAVVLLSGHYSLAAVAGLELVNGAIAAFTSPALRGVLPDLVDASGLQRANSLLGSTQNATKILGPSIAGVLVVTAGSGVAIAADAVSYLLAAALLLGLRLPAPVRAERSTVLADIRHGRRAFRSIRWVWTVVLSWALMNLVSTGTWQILGPTLTARASGRAAWGLVLSVRAVGLLLASVALYRLVIRRLLAVGKLASAVGGLPLLALGLRLPLAWLLVAALLAGVGSSIASIGWDTSLQEHVPAGVLARVASYDDLLSFAAIPIGQLAVGPLAVAYGPRAVTFVAGMLFVLVALAPLGVRTVRQLTHEPAAP